VRRVGMWNIGLIYGGCFSEYESGNIKDCFAYLFVLAVCDVKKAYEE
jgi:hypothetical protein